MMIVARKVELECNVIIFGRFLATAYPLVEKTLVPWSFVLQSEKRRELIPSLRKDMNDSSFLYSSIIKVVLRERISLLTDDEKNKTEIC